MQTSGGGLIPIQSFSSLLTTQQPSQFLNIFGRNKGTKQPSQFLKLLSSQKISRGPSLDSSSPYFLLSKDQTDEYEAALQKIQFYDAQKHYSEYEEDQTNGDNVLFFEYNDGDDDINSTLQDQRLSDNLTERQGDQGILSQIKLKPNRVLLGGEVQSQSIGIPNGGGGVREPAFLIEKTRPQIVVTFATGILPPVALTSEVFSGFIASCLVYTLLTMTLPTCTTTSSRALSPSFTTWNSKGLMANSSSLVISSRTVDTVTNAVSDKVDTVGNVTSSLVSTKVSPNLLVNTLKTCSKTT